MFKSFTIASMMLLASHAMASPAAEIRCLADNIYHESRGENVRGQLAVANVTINRAKSSRFPQTVCGVVHQRSSRGCQFSWVCAGRVANRESMTYRIILMMAASVYRERVMFGRADHVTYGATFFHNRSVSPPWIEVFRKTTSIGGHDFYAYRPNERG